MLQEESWRGRVEMGICTVVQGGRAGWMWSGICRKEGARAAEWAQRRIQILRGEDPGKGGPLISAVYKPPTTWGRGCLLLRFPSREKAPLLLQHDL